MGVLLCRLSVLLLLFALGPGGFASGSTGQEVLNGIQSRYERVDDVEAGFVQEYLGKVMKGPPKGRGKVYFKKNGMMRWDYETPNQKLITNGKTLWFYQPEEKQVYVTEVSRVIQERTPLAFLSGRGDIRKDFRLNQLSESTSGGEEYYQLELIPKEPESAYSKLILTVEKKSYTVAQVDVHDHLGNVTRTRFLEIRTNVGLSDALFQFVPPAGTEVLNIQDSPGKSPQKK